MIHSPADLLTGLPPIAAYSVIAGLVGAESVLLVGAFVPTLTLLWGAGVLARTGTLDLPVVIGSAAVAVVLGDLQAYRTGRRLGPGLRRSALGRRVPAVAWDRAWSLIRRRGGPALFVCRFVPVVRTVAPYLTGMTATPYRRLAPYSVTAGVAWACLEAGTGYLAADSYERLAARPDGHLVAGAVAGAALAAVTVGLWSRRGRRAAQPAAGPVPGELSTSPRSIARCR